MDEAGSTVRIMIFDFCGASNTIVSVLLFQNLWQKKQKLKKKNVRGQLPFGHVWFLLVFCTQQTQFHKWRFLFSPLNATVTLFKPKHKGFIRRSVVQLNLIVRARAELDVAMSRWAVVRAPEQGEAIWAAFNTLKHLGTPGERIKR